MSKKHGIGKTTEVWHIIRFSRSGSPGIYHYKLGGMNQVRSLPFFCVFGPQAKNESQMKVLRDHILPFTGRLLLEWFCCPVRQTGSQKVVFL